MIQGVYLFIFSLVRSIVPHAYSDPRNLNVALEFSKIRQALALVEAHVNHIQCSSASSASISARQPSFDVPTTLPPIKCLTMTNQDLAKSDLPEQEVAPGARGQSNSGGFYSGPTSAISYLTSVGLLRVTIPQNDADRTATICFWIYL